MISSEQRYLKQKIVNVFFSSKGLHICPESDFVSITIEVFGSIVKACFLSKNPVDVFDIALVLNWKCDDAITDSIRIFWKDAQFLFQCALRSQGASHLLFEIAN
jgi:hypothetical protein